jgi:methylmalonyl-CoA mutase cobalamin-binding subunit
MPSDTQLVIPPACLALAKARRGWERAGVSAIYGPGTNISAAAAEILGLIRKQRLAA